MFTFMLGISICNATDIVSDFRDILNKKLFGSLVSFVFVFFVPDEFSLPSLYLECLVLRVFQGSIRG